MADPQPREAPPTQHREAHRRLGRDAGGRGEGYGFQVTQARVETLPPSLLGCVTLGESPPLSELDSSVLVRRSRTPPQAELPTALPSSTSGPERGDTHWLSVGSLRSSGRTLKKSRRWGQREILTGRLMRALQYSVRVPWRLSAARCPSNHRGAGGAREGQQRPREHTPKSRPQGGGRRGARLGCGRPGLRAGEPCCSPGRWGMILFCGLMSPASIGNISFNSFWTRKKR